MFSKGSVQTAFIGSITISKVGSCQEGEHYCKASIVCPGRGG